MANEDSLGFDLNGVKGCLSSMEEVFNKFAEVLKNVNLDVNDYINNYQNSAIWGDVGKCLLETWNANASTFGDFHTNFDAWYKVVTTIASNYETFSQDILALYGTTGSRADGVEASRNAALSGLKTGQYAGLSGVVENGDYAGSNMNFINRYGDGPHYFWTDEEGKTHHVYQDANGKVLYTFVSYYDENLKKNVEKWYDGNGIEIDPEKVVAIRTLAEAEKYDKAVTTPIPTTLVLNQKYTVLEQGSTNAKDFTYQGSVTRGNMQRVQIFSDSEGKLYYYEDGVMKKVTHHSYVTGGYAPEDNYQEQATLADLGKNTLYFQSESGKYDASNANKSYNNNVNTTGMSGTNYSLARMDYAGFDPSKDYPGKGTTLYLPPESYEGGVEGMNPFNQVNTDAKEMITTSVIDVRDNLREEASNMQWCLDNNASYLTPAQQQAIRDQIKAREDLASRMGEAVQFGTTVDDGVIGDWGTFSVTNNKEAYKKVVEEMNYYAQTMEGFVSLDDIIAGNY